MVTHSISTKVDVHYCNLFVEYFSLFVLAAMEAVLMHFEKAHVFK